MQKLISMKKYALYPAVLFPEEELEGLFEVVNNDFLIYETRLKEFSRLELMVEEENRLLAYRDTLNTFENRMMQDIMSIQRRDIEIKTDQIRLMAENIEILSKTNESLQNSNSHYQRQLQSGKKWPYIFGASFGISIGLVLGFLIN